MTALILGSTGNVGPHAIARLVERGRPVRVLARDSGRARRLLPTEVEVFEGDPARDQDLLRAADGAESVLLISRHEYTMSETQLRVVRALRHDRIRIVKLSATSCAVNAAGPHVGRQHWEIEEVLKAGGNPFVILRPNTFMQVGIGQLIGGAVQSGEPVPNPISDAGVSMVDSRDVGAVAAAALDTDAWDGQTLVLTGPEAVSYPAIADLVAKATGVPLDLFETDPARTEQALIARGLEPWEAGHYRRMYELLRNGASADVTDDVHRVTGRAPRTVHTYITETVATGLFVKIQGQGR